MRIVFEDKDLERLVCDEDNRKYRKYIKDRKFRGKLKEVVLVMRNAERTRELRQYSYLHYEQLKGTNGLSSVRVMNGRIERLIFREIDDGIEIQMLEMNNDHYGKE